MADASKVTVEVAETMAFGRGGWVRYQSSGLPWPVFVRVEDHGGRLVIVEFYAGGDDPAGPITQGALRSVPLSRIEAEINVDSQRVRPSLNLPRADLRRLISHFDTTFGPRSRRHWIWRSFQAQLTGNDEPQVPMERLAGDLTTHTHTINAHLEVPTRKPYTDGFYRAVADVYNSLTPYTSKPANSICDANGVRPSTAHKWIKVARSKGFIGPGSVGRAG